MIITEGGRLPSRLCHTQDVSGLNCTIVVSGELGEQFEGAFADLALSPEAGTTRISGAVTDQAEFQGVLHQLFDLGLEIVSISTSPG